MWEIHLKQWSTISIIKLGKLSQKEMKINKIESLTKVIMINSSKIFLELRKVP